MECKLHSQKGLRIVKDGHMTRRKKTLWICLGAMAALLVVRLATSPVIFRVPLFMGENSDEPRFVLLNPFRNRGPEKAANQALVSIQAGHCKETLESALDMQPEDKVHMCGMFAQIPLDVWELRNRRDSRDECELIYWHHGYPILDVFVRKIEGRWKLTWINYWN
jgi:hypothetical protein